MVVQSFHRWRHHLLAHAPAKTAAGTRRSGREGPDGGRPTTTAAQISPRNPFFSSFSPHSVGFSRLIELFRANRSNLAVERVSRDQSGASVEEAKERELTFHARDSSIHLTILSWASEEKGKCTTAAEVNSFGLSPPHADGDDDDDAKRSFFREAFVQCIKGGPLHLHVRS